MALEMTQLALVVVCCGGVYYIHAQISKVMRHPTRFRNALRHLRGYDGYEADYLFMKTLIEKDEETAVAQDRQLKRYLRGRTQLTRRK